MAPFFKAQKCNRCRNSFTLIEVLVAITVLVLLLAIIAAVTQSTALVIHRASSKVTTYAAARSAFDTMNGKLAQATLNTYLDYYATNGSGVGYLQTTVTNTFSPTIYGRVSNLHFLVRQNSNPQTAFDATGDPTKPCYGQEVYFQCPTSFATNSAYLSTQGLLNACGYYVQYCDNSSFRPSMLSGSKWRYRLVQAIEPTEDFQVYTYAISDSTQWTQNIANTGPATALAKYALPLADNIIALVIRPQMTGAQESVTPLVSNYICDSQSNAAPNVASNPPQPLTADQLPPILQITMIVIDEVSAVRIDTKSSTPPPVIENALKGKFTVTSNYAADLASVESSLSLNKIAFEVLNTAVVLRESKWSQ